MKLSGFVYLLIIIFFGGCASSNAFTKFHISSNEQYAFSNFQLSDISYKQRSIGTIEAIYLNNIFPKRYNHDEYFYVIVYLRSNQALKYTLNGHNPLQVTKLAKHNHFSNLLPIIDNWHKYYLVKFKHIANENLVFRAKQANFLSYPLRYLKTLR